VELTLAHAIDWHRITDQLHELELVVFGRAPSTIASGPEVIVVHTD
jgi:hypothetical protein